MTHPHENDPFFQLVRAGIALVQLRNGDQVEGFVRQASASSELSAQGAQAYVVLVTIEGTEVQIQRSEVAAATRVSKQRYQDFEQAGIITISELPAR